MRPDGDTKVVRAQRAGRNRMRHPLMAGGVGVELGAKRPLVRIALSALIDQRALRARKRRRLVIAFDEVLPDLRPDEFQHKAHMPDDRVIAQDGELGLQQIMKTRAHQISKHQHRQTMPATDPKEQRQQQTHA